MTDCARSWSFFICQPLNQQQTARYDKCDVGWGGRAGNQKRKERKRNEKIFPRCLLLI
nr:MAG TPA: hypothetical protein [Caudoviricetes sp.]